jgi:hypothetical protein
MFGLKKRADGPTLLMTCRPIGFGGLSHGDATDYHGALPSNPESGSQNAFGKRVRSSARTAHPREWFFGDRRLIQPPGGPPCHQTQPHERETEDPQSHVETNTGKERSGRYHADQA